MIDANLVSSAEGGLVSSLAGMLVGFGLLIPFYAHAELGAGCVKSQAVFGIWVGAAATPAVCCTMVAIATVVGALLTVAAGMTVGQATEPQEREYIVFPAQITLSLGSMVAAIGFLVAGMF